MKENLLDVKQCNSVVSKKKKTENINNNNGGVTNEFGHGALHRAVINNDDRLIRKLVESGIDTTEKDSLGFTACQLAIILGKDYLLPYLNGEITECEVDSDTSRSSSISSRRYSMASSFTSSISSISSLRSRINSILEKQRSRANSWRSNDGGILETSDINGGKLNDVTGEKQNEEKLKSLDICNFYQIENFEACKVKNEKMQRNYNNKVTETAESYIVDINRNDISNSIDNKLLNNDDGDCSIAHTSCGSSSSNVLLRSGRYGVTKDCIGIDINNNNNDIDDDELITRNDKDVITTNTLLNEYKKTSGKNVNTLAHNSSVLNSYVNKDSGHTKSLLKRSLSWPLISSELDHKMDDWEVWDVSEENEKELLDVSEDHGTKEGQLERSTRVSVRTSFVGDSSTDLTTDELEEVQITYVFKDKQKSNDDLTKSCDYLAPRRSKASVRESLIKRLSLSFDKTKSKNNNNLTAGKQENSSVNMISKSRSMEHISEMKDEPVFELSAAKTKRHFSETRSDLSNVGLNSDEDNESSEHLNFHSDDSTDELFEQPTFSLVHQSTPLNRSLSTTDIKKSSTTNSTKEGEEVYVYSMSALSNSMNRSKSMDRIPVHKTGAHSNTNQTGENTKISDPSDVVRRQKTRSQVDSYKIDSGYFSPDDSRKDSVGGGGGGGGESSTHVEARTPYTITFTPERSSTNAEAVDNRTDNRTSIQRGLASMIPMGLSEAITDDESAGNIIDNVHRTHSVEERGQFQLSVNRSDDRMKRLSFTEEDEYVDIDFVVDDNDVTKEDKVHHDFGNSHEEELNILEGSHDSQDDQVDCGKYRLMTSSPLEIRVQCATPEENELNETHHSIEQGSGDFSIMHSTCPEVNHEDPSCESVEELENTGRGPRKISINNDGGSSMLEDSINSFEAHEREYALASLNGTPTMPSTPIDTEAEEGHVYRDWDEMNDNRKLTMTLLEYLPPIIEEEKSAGCETADEDKDSETCDVNQPLNEEDNNEEKKQRPLSAENLRRHCDDHVGDDETVKQDRLHDFLTSSGGAASVASSQADDAFDEGISNNEGGLGLDQPDRKPAMTANTSLNEQDSVNEEIIAVETENLLGAISPETNSLTTISPTTNYLTTMSPTTSSLTTISPTEDNDDDDYYLSPLSKQNVDFNSRYSLTFSDIDSEEEENINEEESPALGPTSNFTIPQDNKANVDKIIYEGEPTTLLPVTDIPILKVDTPEDVIESKSEGEIVELPHTDDIPIVKIYTPEKVNEIELLPAAYISVSCENVKTAQKLGNEDNADVQQKIARSSNIPSDPSEDLQHPNNNDDDVIPAQLKEEEKSSNSDRSRENGELENADDSNFNDYDIITLVPTTTLGSNGDNGVTDDSGVNSHTRLQEESTCLDGSVEKVAETEDLQNDVVVVKGKESTATNENTDNTIDLSKADEDDEVVTKEEESNATNENTDNTIDLSKTDDNDVVVVKGEESTATNENTDNTIDLSKADEDDEVVTKEEESNATNENTENTIDLSKAEDNDVDVTKGEESNKPNENTDNTIDLSKADNSVFVINGNEESNKPNENTDNTIDLSKTDDGNDVVVKSKEDDETADNTDKTIDLSKADDGDDGNTKEGECNQTNENTEETIDQNKTESEAEDIITELNCNDIKRVTKLFPRQHTIEQAIECNNVRRNNTTLKRDPSLAWDTFQPSYIDTDYYDNDNEGYEIDTNEEYEHDKNEETERYEHDENGKNEKNEGCNNDKNNGENEFDENDKNTMLDDYNKEEQDDVEVATERKESQASDPELEMYESIENVSNASMEDIKEIDESPVQQPTQQYDIKTLETDLAGDNVDSVIAILQINSTDHCSHLLKQKIQSTSTYAQFYLHLAEQDTDDHATDIGFKLYEIMENERMNFLLVINEILCYLGVLKSEHTIPQNIHVNKLLEFLTKFIQTQHINIHHIQTFAYFLIKPSAILSKHQVQRIQFITTCLRKEMQLTQDSMTPIQTMTSAFQKINKYLVHICHKQSTKLAQEYIVVNMTEDNSATFVLNVLMHMGLLKSEEAIQKSDNLSAPLFLLDAIIEHCQQEQLSSGALDILTAFLSDQLAWKYRLCNNQRIALNTKILNKNQ